MADHKIYVAADDSWGDAHNLRIVKMSDEEITQLSDMSESEVLDFLRRKEATLLVQDYAQVPYVSDADATGSPWQLEHDIPMDEEARLRGSN